MFLHPVPSPVVLWAMAAGEAKAALRRDAFKWFSARSAVRAPDEDVDLAAGAARRDHGFKSDEFIGLPLPVGGHADGEFLSHRSTLTAWGEQDRAPIYRGAGYLVRRYVSDLPDRFFTAADRRA